MDPLNQADVMHLQESRSSALESVHGLQAESVKAKLHGGFGSGEKAQLVWHDFREQEH